MEAPLPEDRPDKWVVGISQVPRWVLDIEDFSVSMDAHGNAYFQFEDRAVIVARGSMVYKDDDVLVFGERWGIVGDGTSLDQGGVICLPVNVRG